VAFTKASHGLIRRFTQPRARESELTLTVPGDLIAHRLGADYGPDNSATALERSLSGPLEGFETDVCLTADAALVLLHSPLLSQGTTLSGWAHERTLRELMGASILDAAGEPAGEPPLTLDQLLEAAPGELIVQVEVKTQSDSELARRTAAAICDRYARSRERERLEVISFHHEACEVAAAAGFRTRLVIWADYAPQMLAGWAVRHGVTGVKVEHFLLTDALVGTLRAAGITVSTGTVNDVALLEQVLAAQPKCITTDRPHELRAEALAAGLLPVSYDAVAA
jgi:glycerophosphoryl diester phosphodiesterase